MRLLTRAVLVTTKGPMGSVKKGREEKVFWAEKVWMALRRGMFVERRASARVPEERLVAFREVRPAPGPVKEPVNELDALLNVIRPV